MGTRTAKEPGEIPVAKLKEKAKTAGKKIKYYVISRGNDEVLVRYATPEGISTSSKGFTYVFVKGVPRFLNYWHAYAYGLKLKAKRESEKW